MAWTSTDGSLTAMQAARRYVADTFENRAVNAATFSGAWQAGANQGEWTFELEGGSQVYQLLWTGREWRCVANIMPPTGAHPCAVCGADMGWDRPSGVCSEACLRKAQGFPV